MNKSYEFDDGNLVDKVHNLMRRLPMRDSARNFDFFVNNLPEHADELLSTIDRPLTVLTCELTGNKYIASEFNRFSTSYRSPWSNQYSKSVPASIGNVTGYTPPENLRKLEIALNDIFKHYVKLYFEYGVASAYVWETYTGFAVAVLIKKGHIYTLYSYMYYFIYLFV